MTDTPANWQSMSIEERKKWALDNGIEYEVKSSGKDIRVTIDSKQMNDMMRRLVEAEKARDDYKNKLVDIGEQLLQKKKFKLGCDDASIKTPEQLIIWEQTQAELLKNNHEDPIGKGGIGEVDISGNLGNNEEGFENERELVDFLRNKAAVGDIQSKKILNKLFYKTLAGRRENPRMMKEEFSNKINELTGKEQGLIQRLNEDFQAREKLRREQKGE